MRSQARKAVLWAGIVASAHGAYVQQQLLVGYGLYLYEPLCAEACLRSFQGYMLDCTVMSHDTGGHMMSMGFTSPDCWGNDAAFLTSVAYCMSIKCPEQNAPASKIEILWEEQITGHPDIPPKWSYGQAVARVNPSPPRYQLTKNDTVLNVTSLVDPNVYLAQWNVLSGVYRESILESAYSIAIVVLAVGLPIVLTALGYLPFVPALIDRVKPWLLWPSTIGTFSVRPLPYLLGNAPTVGQGIYIALFLIVNIVLSGVQFQPRQPNAWFSTQWNEVMAYIFYRFGAFSLALFPVVVLFSSRNNVLLWMTNWSHATYLLLHRWVGRLFTLYAVLHSIMGLMIYAQYQTTDWWIWGAVATVASVLLMVGGGLYVRKAQYEFFLISHILLAVFCIAGCWYHVIGWYNSMGLNWPEKNAGGYELWIYFTCAVWFFDRIVRVGRVLKHGLRRAKVTDLNEGYVRVDIPGVRLGPEPGTHLYAYFPTLSPLRPWENHPFSVIPTAMLEPLSVPLASSHSSKRKSSASGSGNEDPEKAVATSTTSKTLRALPPVGVTLFIRKSSGITKHLAAHDNLLTLLDGPYPNNETRSLLRCDRLLIIGGGIGITGLLPWTRAHPNAKLAWSVRESARVLVDAVDGALAGVVDKEVRIGRRLDITTLLADEVEAGWGRVGVVVSGPGGLCDNVRAAVVTAGRNAKGRTIFELEVDAYSW